MHDPNGYLPRRFINDFETFWTTLDALGPARPLLGPDEEAPFRFFTPGDLILVPSSRDVLAGIHKARRIPFLYGIMFSILLDQALHGGFPHLYPTWNLTLFNQGRERGGGIYPKLCHDSLVGGRLVMARPWMILGSPILRSRDWKVTDLVLGFRAYAAVMVDLWGREISQGTLPGITWDDFAHSIVKDPHMAIDPFGQVIHEAIRAKSWTRIKAA